MEIAIVGNSEEKRMRDVYDASQNGSESTLKTLLQQDSLILHRLSSRRTLLETPLHISALLGHLECTRTLLAHCSQLALELDSFQSTPLHLASPQGHIHIVSELLLARGEACLVRDQEHRIPLHCAVIRGRREVVLELIRAKPESLRLHDDKGKNIFHLCVMHNHLEILEDLVALDTHDTNKLLTEGDSDGNNIHFSFGYRVEASSDCELPYFNSKDKIRSIELKERHGLYCCRYCSSNSQRLQEL
ncbi:ankyrin repeat-containing protein BDA1-like [Neltuma alba]|uniref:ankyrin repeat-containing protein BDA1-like n=1 Tax=Neltuma alba TaxID=207710 RepID=UPI0010A2D6B0|nr:ankyrin repeat-containing protein BDA1-like [Prosopis alba]